MVRVDPGQIKHVILNLVLNARDAMPHGGTLTIQTATVALDDEYVRRHAGSSPGEHIMMVVGDSGVGIPNEAQAHIFEPSFTTKEPAKCAGLGLAMCLSIVTQSGGHIAVHSEPGHGSRFEIYLPRAERLPTT